MKTTTANASRQRWARGSTPRSRHVTIRQVARQAGVSPATVSVVLNDRPNSRISEKTRRHVLSVSRGMGYEDSLLSRFVKRPLKHLGVVVTDVVEAGSTYFAEVLAGVQQVSLSKGYFPVLFPMEHRCVPGVSGPLIELVRSKRVDGWIIDKEDVLDAEVQVMHRRKVPLVLVNTWEPANDPTLNWAGIDNRLGARLAMEHLIRLGHVQIAFITRPYWSLGERTRRGVDAELITEYQRLLTECGLGFRPELLREGSLVDPQVVGGAVDGLMKIGARPTAIFCGDDAMAIMVMNSLRARGYQVPRDVSVVGYGDIPVVRVSSPLLTTVHCALREMGQVAARHLIDCLESSEPSVLRRRLRPELMIRQSSAATKGGTT